MSTDPVAEQLDAYNARDLDRFLACYTKDVVVVDAAGTRMVEGADALRAVYGRLFADSPDLHAEVLNRIRAGDFVIDEERVRGMNLEGMPPEMHAAVVYRLRGGRIEHVRLLI